MINQNLFDIFMIIAAIIATTAVSSSNTQPEPSGTVSVDHSGVEITYIPSTEGE